MIELIILVLRTSVAVFDGIEGFREGLDEGLGAVHFPVSCWFIIGVLGGLFAIFFL